jgi:HK97 gp10 family phage protein
MIQMYADSRNKKVFIKLETMAHDVLYEVERAFYEMGRLMRDDLRKGLRFGPRGGRIYKHYNALTGKFFKRQSSAPGEYPQRISGTLRDSIIFNVNASRQLFFGVQNPSPAGFDTQYAKYLEDGTRKMRRRLLIKYTVKKNGEQMKNILLKRINTAIKSLG